MPTDLGPLVLGPPVLGPPVLGPLRAVKLVVCDVDGTLTDGVIGMNVHGEEFKNFSVLDGMGINWLLRAGIGVAFLSARKSAIVEKRAAELGVENCWSGVSEKLSHLEAFLEKNGLDWKEVCFVGDDLNDLPCLSRAGFGVAVANARPELRERARYTTEARGGNGAVREVAELILKAQDHWKSVLERYL